MKRLLWLRIGRSMSVQQGFQTRVLYLVTALVIIAMGLGLRLMPLGLPFFVTKYGGSIMWGTMVYLLVKAFRPSMRVGAAAPIAFGISALTESSRLYHAPELDAFRQTFAGALLLGRVFSGWNILAYGAGVALAAITDRNIRLGPHLMSRPTTHSSVEGNSAAG